METNQISTTGEWIKKLRYIHTIKYYQQQTERNYW